jgi:hypothetical protein
MLFLTFALQVVSYKANSLPTLFWPYSIVFRPYKQGFLLAIAGNCCFISRLSGKELPLKHKVMLPSNWLVS